MNYDIGWLNSHNEKFTSLRSHQSSAISEILSAYEHTNVVVVEAPTGSGKTVLAEMVRHELRERGLFLATTIQLQQQFGADFRYSAELKGRRNYYTEYADPRSGITCDDCNGTPPAKSDCKWCEKRGTCPYERAKAAAYKSPVAVLNSAYFLHEANGVDKGIGRSRGFIVVDEADLLERQLLSYVEFSVNEKVLSDFKMTPLQKGVHKKTIVEWLEELAGRVGFWLQTHEPIYGDDSPSSITLMRRFKRNEKLDGELSLVLSGDLDDNWVRDNKAGPMVLKPIHVKEWATSRLWKHSRKVIPGDVENRELDSFDSWEYNDDGDIVVPGKWMLMSGTIGSVEPFMKLLGKQPGEYEFVQVESTFPIENRPIYLTNAADMSMKGGMEEGGWNTAVTALAHILELHPDERILVHTVSYKLARYLAGGLYSDRVVTYLSSEDKTTSLEKYVGTKDAVLIAASMDRGVDLADELCGVIVVAKLPFPYLGDPQTNARMHSREDGLGQTWYEMETGRTLVQMTGRGVRSDTDQCVTYILDMAAGGMIRKTYTTPRWWREAVSREFNARKWRKEYGL